MRNFLTKSLCSLAAFWLLSASVQAQGVGINDDNTTPDNSAMLDVKSAEKGLLIPRLALTSTAVAAPVAAPATALLVYNTQTAGDVTPGFYYWNGAIWVRLASAAALGDSWLLTGNASTVDGTNFLGTTDNVPLNFRVNNLRAGRIENTATTGNTAFGYDVGTTGSWTTAFGARALANNAAASFGNVAIGRAAMELNTTGAQNTALGSAALNANTSGFGNVAVGQQALQANTTANANTAIGYYALLSNSTGANNTAGGESTLRFNTIGAENSGWGLRALFSNTTGSRNSGLGSGAIFNVTTGDNNSGLGYQAGAGLTTGSNNTFLGSGSTGTANLMNATAVGANVALTQDNTVILGNTANIGIGTSTPAERLEVVGNIRNSALAGVGVRMVSSDANGNLVNVAAGNNGEVLTMVAGAPAWAVASSGSGWEIIGNTGTNPNANFVGTIDNQPLVFRTNNVRAGLIGTPAFGRSVYFGYQAGMNTTSGNANAVVGFSSFVNNTTGSGNAVLGTGALSNNVSGNQNVAIGTGALSQNNANNNIAIGFSTMSSNLTGIENIAIGSSALANNTAGSENVAIGILALANNTANHNTAVGSNTLSANTIGTNNSAFGSGALQRNTTGTGNTGIGNAALNANTTGVNNTAIGYYALPNSTIGVDNSALGISSLASNVSGNFNTALGSSTLTSNITGNHNTAVGHLALSTVVTGEENTAVGKNTLRFATSNQNTAIGAYALNNLSTGANNTAVGTNAGINLATGSNNTLLGHNTNAPANINNATAIGANVILAQDNTVILGNNANVGIGTSSPAEKLEVVGNIRNSVLAGTGTRIVGSDANGNLVNVAAGNNGEVLTMVAGTPAWAAAGSSSGWTLTGNAGTDATTNFVGTTDDAPLMFRTNNTPAGRIETNSTGRGVYFGQNAGNAGSGFGSVGIGAAALANNTGVENVAVGYRVLQRNSTGAYNVAIGGSAMNGNVDGSNNVAIGQTALTANLDGSENIAIGSGALVSLTTNTINLAIGRNALASATNAYANIALGAESLQGVTTGAHNLAIGHGAGATMTGENDVTIVGAHADGVAGIFNAGAFGSGAMVDGGNKIRLGNVLVEEVETQFAYVTVSDKRFKFNVQDDVRGLDFITRLRPVTYNFDTEKLDAYMNAGNKNFDPSKQDYSASKNIRRTGFLAQDVEAICKELDYDFDGIHAPKDETGKYTVAYSQFVMPLVKSVQELNTKVTKLETENAALRAQAEEVKALRAEMDALKALLETEAKK